MTISSIIKNVCSSTSHKKAVFTSFRNSEILRNRGFVFYFTFITTFTYVLMDNFWAYFLNCGMVERNLHTVITSSISKDQFWPPLCHIKGGVQHFLIVYLFQENERVISSEYFKCYIFLFFCTKPFKIKVSHRLLGASRSTIWIGSCLSLKIIKV